MRIILKDILNSTGTHHCASLIASGDVDRTSDWSFSAEDGNRLLGANGDDWPSYGKWFMATTTDPQQTKAHYAYPFGKNGKVYRSALIAIRSRAAQQNETAIFNAAGHFIDSIDGKQMKNLPSMRQRAWSQFEVKALDDSLRVLEGVATTPTPDRMGDIVEPKGAVFDLPLPFLWQHDAEQPVGSVTSATTTKDGIGVRIQMAKTDEAGRLKDRLDEAWQSLKIKLVRGLSIGFAPLEYSYMEDTGGYRFIKWSWLELSAVTIPANAEASIAVIKTCGAKGLIALKRRPIIRLGAKAYVPQPKRPQDLASRYFQAVEDVESEGN